MPSTRVVLAGGVPRIRSESIMCTQSNGPTSRHSLLGVQSHDRGTLYPPDILRTMAL